MRGIETLMAEGRGPGCSGSCAHVNNDPWPHAVKLQEDAGVIHTDDCGFWRPPKGSNRDPGDFCTAGYFGVTCRVFSRAKDLPK